MPRRPPRVQLGPAVPGRAAQPYSIGPMAPLGQQIGQRPTVGAPQPQKGRREGLSTLQDHRGAAPRALSGQVPEPPTPGVLSAHSPPELPHSCLLRSSLLPAVTARVSREQLGCPSVTSSFSSSSLSAAVGTMRARRCAPSHPHPELAGRPGTPSLRGEREAWALCRTRCLSVAPCRQCPCSDRWTGSGGRGPRTGARGGTLYLK